MHLHREAAGAVEPWAQHLAAYRVTPQTTERRKSTWESLFVFAEQSLTLKCFLPYRNAVRWKEHVLFFPQTKREKKPGPCPRELSKNLDSFSDNLTTFPQNHTGTWSKLFFLFFIKKITLLWCKFSRFSFS